MHKTVKEQKELIGQRIKALREAVGLTQKQLADEAGIALGTFRSIESGDTFTGDFLIMIANYFAMDLSELVNYKEKVQDPSMLNERMKTYHATNILNATPSLKTIIEVNLANDQFMSKPRLVKEINAFLKSNYSNTIFSSSTLSQALINAVKAGFLERVKLNEKNYGYLSGNTKTS